MSNTMSIYRPPAEQIFLDSGTRSWYRLGYAEPCTFWQSLPVFIFFQPLTFFMILKNCAADFAASISAAMLG